MVEGYMPSLVYLITFRGHWSTIDDFIAIPFHLVLSSAALVELVKFIPVHSLILSFRLFFSLPFLLFPFTVRCRIVFVKPEDLEMWSNDHSFRFLPKVRSFCCLDLSANILIGDTVLV